MDSETLKKDVDIKSAWVDERLVEFVTRDEPVDNLHEAMLYAMGLDIDDRLQRGKRIRPVLCLQACEALGGDLERAMPFACAIEIFHNFALVHDDLEDGDRRRRDRDTVWVRYGAPQAVNIGDYMFTKVFALLTEDAPRGEPALDFQLLRLMVETLDHTHIGQALDMNARGKRAFTMDDYLRIAREKTGYYLAAPILGGMMVAGADKEALDGVRRFGQCIGPLYQVIDDLIDLTEGKGRGETGSDVREGKRSYLVAYSAERVTEDERARLFDILDLPRDETNEDHIAFAVELFERYKALEAARSYALELYEDSIQCLSAVPRPLADLLETTFQGLALRKR